MYSKILLFLAFFVSIIAPARAGEKPLGSETTKFEIKSQFPTWVSMENAVGTNMPPAPSKGSDVFSWWATMGTHYRLFTQAYLGTTRSYPTPSKFSYFPDVTDSKPIEIQPVIGAFSDEPRYYDFLGVLDRGKPGHNYAAYLRNAANAHVDMVWNLGQIHSKHHGHVDLIMSKDGAYYKDLVYQSVVFANTGEFANKPNTVYWEIGNEINSWKRFGLRDLGEEANNVENARDYLEYYLAPAAEAIRRASADLYGDAGEIPILLGNVTFVRDPKTMIFLEAILDGVIVGEHAPTLAGKRGYEIVDIIGIHYSKGISHLQDRYYKRWIEPGYVDGMWNTEEHGHAGLGDYSVLVDAIRWLDYWAQRSWSPDTARVMFWGDQSKTNRKRSDGLASETTGVEMELFLGQLLRDYQLVRLKPEDLFVDADGDFEQYGFTVTLPSGKQRCIAVVIPLEPLNIKRIQLTLSDAIGHQKAYLQPVERGKVEWGVSAVTSGNTITLQPIRAALRAEDVVIIVAETVAGESAVSSSLEQVNRSKPLGMKIATYWKEGKLGILPEDARSFSGARIGGFPLKTKEGVFNFLTLEKYLSSMPDEVTEIIIPVKTTSFTSLRTNPEAFKKGDWFCESQDGRTIYQQTFRNFNHNSESLREVWQTYFAAIKEAVPPLLEGMEDRTVYYGFNNELSMSPRSTIGLKQMDEGKSWTEKSKVHLGYGRLASFYLPEKGLSGEFLQGFQLTDYSEATQKKFRVWLEGGYGSLDALNQSWNTAYRGWGDVDAPRDIATCAQTQAWRDWLTFRPIDFAEFFAWVQGELGGSLPVAHNFIGHRYLMADPYSAVNIARMAPYLDLVGIDYPDLFDAFILNETDKPYAILENAVGYTPEHMYRNILMNGASGYGSLYHWHRTSDYIQERRSVLKGVEQAKPFLPLMDGRMIKGRVGVLHSPLTSFDRMMSPVKAWANAGDVNAGEDELQRLTKIITGGPLSFTGKEYLSDVLGTWAALLEAGYFPRIIDEETLEESDLEGLDALLLPGVSRLRTNTVGLLSSFDGMVLFPENFEVSIENLDPSFGSDGYSTIEDVSSQVTLFESRRQQTVLALPSINAYYGVFDNLQREIIDYDGIAAQRGEIVALASILDEGGIVPDIEIISPKGGELGGVWFTMLESDTHYRLVLFDYQNWWDWWDTQFHSPLSLPIDGLTQPRCFLIEDEAVRSSLMPSSKFFTLKWRLPGAVSNVGGRLILESEMQSPLVSDVEVSIAGGFLTAKVDAMAFLAIIEVPKIQASELDFPTQ